jgi:hypothetical protein
LGIIVWARCCTHTLATHPTHAPNDDEVRGQLALAVLEHHLADGTRGSRHELRDNAVHAEAHALGLVEGAHHGADGGAQHALKGLRLHAHDSHVGALRGVVGG